MKGQRRSFESELLSSEESSFGTPTYQDMILGAEEWNWVESLNWQLQNNGKKVIRLWKEDSMCDLK
jgi:hypothetical protein